MQLKVMQISKSMAPLLHCCHGSICGNGLIDNIDTGGDNGASCTNYDNGVRQWHQQFDDLGGVSDLFYLSF